MTSLQIQRTAGWKCLAWTLLADCCTSQQVGRQTVAPPMKQARVATHHGYLVDEISQITLRLFFAEIWSPWGGIADGVDPGHNPTPSSFTSLGWLRNSLFLCTEMKEFTKGVGVGVGAGQVSGRKVNNCFSSYLFTVCKPPRRPVHLINK